MDFRPRPSGHRGQVKGTEGDGPRCASVLMMVLALWLLVGGCAAKQGSGASKEKQVSPPPRAMAPDPTAPAGEGSTLEDVRGMATIRVHKKVEFAPGSNSATLRRALIRGERDQYTIRARAGQRMTVRISSLEDNAAAQIFEPGRDRPLLAEVVQRYGTFRGERSDPRRWSGELPKTGDYVILVGGTRGNAAYELKVTVV